MTDVFNVTATYVNNNYWDDAGMDAAINIGDYNGGGAGHGPFNGTLSETGNLRLTTGGTVT